MLFTMFPNPLVVLGHLWHRATRNKYVRRHEKLEAWRAKATAAWNARLPAARSSESTCELRRTGPGVSPQLSSLFFSKLPLEVRWLIYSNVLSGKDLLFEVVDQNKDMNGDEIGKEKIPFKLTCHSAQGLLSFPISCKLAYVNLPLSDHYLALNDNDSGIRNQLIISTPATRSDSLESQSTAVSRDYFLGNV